MITGSIMIFSHNSAGLDTTQGNKIIADFLSQELQCLQHTSKEEYKDACTSYVKCSDENFPLM